MDVPKLPQWSATNNERMSLYFQTRDFTRYRLYAREDRAAGRIPQAREWAAEARKAWAQIVRLLS
jgi:hypothetical protein